MRVALASERTLAGTDRELLAYGRRLQSTSETAAMPAGRGILACGRKLRSADSNPTQGLHEEGMSVCRFIDLSASKDPSLFWA